VIGSVNVRLRACSRSNDEQRRRDWFQGDISALAAAAAVLRTPLPACRKARGGAKKKTLLEERFSND
jgi:hypothetical protein